MGWPMANYVRMYVCKSSGFELFLQALNVHWNFFLIRIFSCLIAAIGCPLYAVDMVFSIMKTLVTEVVKTNFNVLDYLLFFCVFFSLFLRFCFCF